MMRLYSLLALCLAAALPAVAQRVEPAPYAPTPEERRQLDEKEQALADRLKAVRSKEIADAVVFLHTAVMADRLNLYANKGHVAAVLRGLETGIQRCDALAKGERPWATQPGRSLRGYISRVDGSVQPYGVVLPAGYDPKSSVSLRLDVVLHGRGPTEVTFLQQMEPPPQSAAAKAPEQLFIELHPFGRGNNGWRWAGERDVFEALEQVRQQYRIDPRRVMLRGFSMGGHGAWHIGVHYPHLWTAVSPGAGFSETRRYLKITDGVPEYQEKAWHIYDAVDYALNLFNTPFIAYGGEKDPQLQASLNMKEAAEKEGLPLKVIIGPNTEHRYHPDSLREIMAQLAVKEGDPKPKRVRFTTWTLKYNQCDWVILDALEEHYRRATVDADAGGGAVKVKTENVAALTLDPIPVGALRAEVDGQALAIEPGRPVRLARARGKWSVRKGREDSERRKRHNLQGPIDDAFTDGFIAVRGTGTAWSAATQAYAESALKRFQEEWRLGFRGEVPVIDDAKTTEEHWGAANLILFGDPASNRVLAKIAGKLPIRWSKDGIRVGEKRYPAGAVPVLVYPNPLNPRKYVVINSGHTWTTKEILASNANLTPKLPDWAILTPAAPQPEVLAADYFDEEWELKAPPRGQ
jgi:predicted esterase